MSQTSEDTSGFLDISPYPNSINSNDPIDTLLFRQQQQQQQSNPSTPFPTTPYSPYSQPSGSNESGQIEGYEEKELQTTMNINNIGNNIGDNEQMQIHSEGRQRMVKEKKERIVQKAEQVIHHRQPPSPSSPSSPFITATSTTLVKPVKEEEKEEEEESTWRFHCSCGIDKENYDDGMPMVQCNDCKAWSHIACARYEEKRGGDYRCMFCRRKKR